MATCPVVAVDVAAGEQHFTDPSGDNGKSHRQAMCQCAAFGLGLTNHAGESGPAKHVADACSKAYGGARRIGHGYAAVAEAVAAAKSEESAGEVAPASSSEAERAAAVVSALQALSVPAGVTFEMCPTSSKATGGWTGDNWLDHPAAVLVRLRAAAEAAGSTETARALPRVTLSSDDPAVFNTSLTEEVEIAVHQMGLSVPALKCAMEDAAGASFLPEPARVRLRERLDSAWAAWVNEVEEGSAKYP